MEKLKKIKRKTNFPVTKVTGKQIWSWVQKNCGTHHISSASDIEMHKLNRCGEGRTTWKNYDRLRIEMHSRNFCFKKISRRFPSTLKKKIPLINKQYMTAINNK
jgi:hypothetical protein